VTKELQESSSNDWVKLVPKRDSRVALTPIHDLHDLEVARFPADCRVSEVRWRHVRACPFSSWP